MIETRFPSDLYPREAIDMAVKIYEPYGAIEVSESGSDFVVRVTATGSVDEAQLVGELGNYALGESIEKSGKSAAPAADGG